MRLHPVVLASALPLVVALAACSGAPSDPGGPHAAAQSEAIPPLEDTVANVPVEDSVDDVSGKTIVSASFAGTGGAEVDGLKPDGVDLPDSVWQTDYVNLDGDFEAFIDTGAGNPAPALHVYDVGSSSGSVALSLKDSGTYKRPKLLSLQVDLMTLNPSTVMLFGFYSAPPAAGDETLTGFTGLAVHTDTGSLDLVEAGTTKSTLPYSGSFNGGAFNTLSYTVHTKTGAISDVTLAGQTYAFTSHAFVRDATGYLALGTLAGGPNGACSYYDNLLIH